MKISSSTDRIPYVRMVMVPAIDIAAIITLFEQTNHRSVGKQLGDIKQGSKSAHSFIAILGEAQHPHWTLQRQIAESTYIHSMVHFGFLVSMASQDFQELTVQNHYLRYSGVTSESSNRVTCVMTGSLTDWRAFISAKFGKENSIYVRLLCDHIVNYLVDNLGTTECILGASKVSMAADGGPYLE